MYALFRNSSLSVAFHKQMFVKADTLEPLKGSSPAPGSGSSSPAPEPASRPSAPKPAPKQPESTEKEPEKELSEDDLKLKAFLSVSSPAFWCDDEVAFGRDTPQICLIIVK